MSAPALNNARSVRGDFDNYLNCLMNQAATVGAKYRVLLYINRTIQKSPQLFKRSPAFFAYVREALQTDVIVSLFRIYDIRSDTVNLKQFLTYTERNLTALITSFYRRKSPLERIPVIKPELIHSHLRTIHATQQVVRSVHLRRHNLYAHTSRHYVENPTKRFPPLSNSEIARLITRTMNILGKYYIASTGRSLDMRISNALDVKNLIYEMRQHRLDVERRCREWRSQVSKRRRT